MLKTLSRSFLGFGTAGAVLAYPAIVDFLTSSIAQNQLIDPEDAHRSFILAGKWGLLPDFRHFPWRFGSPAHMNDSVLETRIWNRKLSSPVGIAAGLDKNAEIVDPLFGLGFGFVEIGSVTPKPQQGNPKPRVFRLVEDRAVINRYGFNSDGIQGVKPRLDAYRKQFPKSTTSKNMLGINLGKNKTTEDAAEDYLTGLEQIGEYADYLVVNISSPNTPGLRALQGSTEMDALLSKVMTAKQSISKLKDIPLLVKIAPDLSPQERIDIAKISLDQNIDGLIVSNTTVSRPASLKSIHKEETGGLSGAPLKEKSFELLKDMYALTQGKIPIISVGGIETGDDAYERIKAGATLVQIYTSMTFGGPGTVGKMNDRLAERLKEDGFSNVEEAIGKAST